MLFCKGKIGWSDYLKRVEEEEKTENYISTTASTNKANTFGKLPQLLHDFFNNYHRLYNTRHNKNIEEVLFKKFKNNLLKSPGFVLKGIKQVRNTILVLIADLLNTTVPKIISSIEKKLKSNKLIFKSLNAGKIAIKFKTVEEYIKYLKGDEVEIRWVIDVISLPGLFSKYEEGLNIIIFKESASDIEIKEYDDLVFDDYYNIKKNNVFIYEYQNREIEPIVLKYPGKISQTNIFSQTKDADLIKHFKKDKDFVVVIKDLLSFIELWIQNVFETDSITNIKMIKLLSNSKHEMKLQLVDNFNKSNYITTANNDLIPVIPSQFDTDKNLKLITNVKDFSLYLKDLDDTIDFIDNFSREIDNEEYEFSKLILDEENKRVVGIELQNKLMIPINSVEYEKKKHRKYPNSKNKLYFEINNALYKKEMPDVDIDFVKEKYDFEVYQRLLLELSNFLNMNETTRDLLETLILDDNFEHRAQVKDILEEIMESIIIFKEPELINYNKFLKYSDNKNIRQLCSIKKDFLCEKDKDNINKLIIPLNKKNVFSGILLESLLSNERIRTQVFTNNINRIIDATNFINDEKHVFIKKEPTFQN